MTLPYYWDTMPGRRAARLVTAGASLAKTGTKNPSEPPARATWGMVYRTPSYRR
ncbi:MAG: hypothetical protein M0Z42_13355 [Actinomycetota bacterium]|jgi:hypothetical protein|nr:hypothetical protein [Actinomycetota bacterium]